MIPLNQLPLGVEAEIEKIDLDKLPLKLIEMGCLPGNSVELVQVAPFSDPMYLNINGTHLAIRKETAIHILIEITNE